MVLRQFEYLVALARERHFGRAAQACHVTQPTLSAAIREMEEELGAPIVERGHRYLGLTPQGLVALERAQRVLGEVAELRREVESLARGVSGRLRLGVVPTALPVVTKLTSAFLTRHPAVTFTIRSLTSHEIQRGIEEFELDAGLTYLDNEPLERVRARPLYAEDYLFLTPAQGPFAGRESLTWVEAAQVPLCLLTPDMQNRRILDGIFRSVGAIPKPAVETNSLLNLVAHAAHGPWSAIVPRPLLQFLGPPGSTKAIPLVEPEAYRSIGLIVADREPLAPLARALMSLALPEPFLD